MLRLILLGLLLACGGLLAAVVAAYAWFGVAGAAAAAVVGLVAGLIAAKVLGGKLFMRLLKLPFQAKGKPLRDAAVRVHAVRRAKPPAPTDGEDEDPREWFVVELTITPQAPDGKGFRGWAPAELLLVSRDAVADDVDDDDEWGVVRKVRAWEDPGGWRDADEDALVGEHRLRLLIGVRPGAPRLLRLRYYFELFGNVNLARAA